MSIMVDPPSGWMYGFPKEFNPKEGESLEEWLVSNGYPKKLVERGNAKHCRYWESVTDDEIK